MYVITVCVVCLKCGIRCSLSVCWELIPQKQKPAWIFFSCFLAPVIMPQLNSLQEVQKKPQLPWNFIVPRKRGLPQGFILPRKRARVAALLLCLHLLSVYIYFSPTCLLSGRFVHDRSTSRPVESSARLF